MTKVVHLTSVHPLYDNRIFWKECKSLCEEGFEMVLIGPYDLESRKKTIEGIKVLAVPEPNNRFERILITTVQVFRAAKEQNGDLYHFHDPELIFAGLLLSLTGKPVIYDMHENVLYAIMSKKWIFKPFRFLLTKAYYLIERLVLNRFAVIYAESSYHSNYPWLKTSETVLNMPKVESIIPIKAKKNNKLTIGYIGRIGINRGSLTTLKSMSLVQKANITLSFELIGGTSEKHLEQLKKIASQNNLDVRFRGFMKIEEGLKIIAKCHIGMAILKPIPNYRESLPTKIFEYMALGVPVITSNFPLYKSIVEKEKCGICVDPENEEEIAKVIIWLLQHPGKAKKMGKRGQAAVLKKYSWQNEKVKLVTLYNQLIND